MTVPANWSECPLHEVVTFNPRHERALDDDLDVSFVPMPVVSERSRNLLPHQSRKLGAVRRGYTHFRDGDVLLAKITPCMENGKAAVARNLVNGIGCGTTELHVLRPNGMVIPDWVYYFVWQERFRNAAEHRMTGAVGQARVPLSFIEEQVIPIPESIAEQRHIVDKLDQIGARLDDSKARLNLIPTILNRFRMSVLASAWKIAGAKHQTLGTLLSEPLANGRSVPDATKGFPVLRLTALKRGAVDLAERKIGEWSRKQAIRFMVRQGDFFVARGNGSLRLVGRGGLLTRKPDEVAFPDTLIRVRVDRTRLLPKFLRLLWDAPDVRRQIQAVARTSAGIWKISQPDIENVILPVPSIVLQAEIVRRVESTLIQAETIEARCKRAKSFADKLMPSVLARAFRGKLVLND